MMKILFLCTANSCRSQMAEGWTRRLHGGEFEAYSAGVAPSKLHPLAARVMREAGVDISAQTSKHFRDLAGVDFNWVITVCDGARENCPVFPGATRTLHRSFEDPARASGSEEEVLAAFRRARDQIREFVSDLPKYLSNRRTS